MTKEELKKEAEEKAEIYFNSLEVDDGNVSDTRFSSYDIFVAYEKGAFDFAEPREKRIAELEALIHAERKRQEQCDDIHLRKIAELEEENAEYKEVFGDCETCKRICDMGNCCDPRTKDGYLLDKIKVITERQKLLKENAELRKDKKELCHSISEGGKACVYLNEKLTKAKELLKNWMQTSKASSCDNINIVTDTEQFLSEVEK